MNSTPRNRGRSNRLVRVLLCTLSQIAKLVVEDGLSSGDVFIKSGQIPGENLVETRRNEIIDASGWEMKLDRKTSKHLSLHSCDWDLRKTACGDPQNISRRDKCFRTVDLAAILQNRHASQ